MGWFKRKNDIDYMRLSNLDELFESLAKRKYWEKIPQEVIKEIVRNAKRNFASEGEGVEVFKQFIFISEYYKAVQNNYIEIVRNETSGMVLGLFSLTLYRIGSQLSKAVASATTHEEAELFRTPADAAFMSAILCNRFMMSAYYGMAVLHGVLFGNKTVGLEFCGRYREAENELLSTPDAELDYFGQAAKEGLNPASARKTYEEIRKHAPDLLPESAGDSQISQTELIAELEKELRQ